MANCSSSIQLTRAADYAVRVMIHLATLPDNHRARLPSLSKATGTPSSFLSKILQALKRAELVSSQRGPQGGFAILDRGRQASLRETVEAIDGPIWLNLCMMNGRGCIRKPHCPAHPVWAQAQSAMLDILNTAIIADLALQQAAHALQFSQSTMGLSRPSLS